LTKLKVNLIQDWMRASQNKQKLYVGKRRRTLEFEAGEHGILSVTLTIGIGRAI